MAISINPVASANAAAIVPPPAQSAGTHSGIHGRGNITAQIKAYDQLLAFENQQFLLEESQNLSANQTDDTSFLGTASLINLSPEALAILNGTANINANSATASASLSGSLNISNLTFAQQQQLGGIFQEFATQPITADTFTQLEASITAAGFNPQQVSLEDLSLAFNNTAALNSVNYSAYEQIFAESQAADLFNA